jgi:response regulator RpfG family c-di-GMP phosphodiesterase
MAPLTSVLIVDDEPAVRDIMSRWVASLGLQAKTAATADEALEALQTEHCDLAVIDVMLPGHDGLWLATQLQRDHPNTAVVIATAYTDLFDADHEPRQIADLLIKPFQRDRFALAVDRGRQWRKQALGDLQWHAALSLELRDRVDAICQAVQDRAAAGVSEIETLLAFANTRTPGTAPHAERVVRYVQSMAREMGAADQPGDALDIAARFHDIGKAAMPGALLTKPCPLTPGETAIMGRHVDVGAEILASTRTLDDAAPLVLSSEEWFAGTPDPHRLSGTAIPLGSRIIAVANAYDEMTQEPDSDRRLDSAAAVKVLLRSSPTQFDPTVVSTFVALLGGR